MRSSITAVVACALAAPAFANPWADSVVSYDAGVGAPVGYDDPTTALGQPTRHTSPDSEFGGATTPFQGAFGVDEIVSIGEGGWLTIQFDDPVTNDPANPFGVDLLIFSNTSYIDVNYPNGMTGPAGSLFETGGVIEVSADGVNFFEIVGAPAEGHFPTLGYSDVSTPFPSGPGAAATDFTKPVDPAFDPAGRTFAELLNAYDGSGGGTGVDIGSVGLSEISFVRISNPVGSGVTPDIDGFADVRVPAPGAVALLLPGALAIRRRR